VLLPRPFPFRGPNVVPPTVASIAPFVTVFRLFLICSTVPLSLQFLRIPAVPLAFLMLSSVAPGLWDELIFPYCFSFFGDRTRPQDSSSTPARFLFEFYRLLVFKWPDVPKVLRTSLSFFLKTTTCLSAFFCISPSPLRGVRTEFGVPVCQFAPFSTFFMNRLLFFLPPALFSAPFALSYSFFMVFWV